MKQSGEFHANADAVLVRKNIEGYVALFHDECLRGEQLADAFVDIIAQSGLTGSATEFLKLLPSSVFPFVKNSLQHLRKVGYRKSLTPGPGCQLTDDELAAYAEELRPKYKALDAAINGPDT